MFKSVGTVKLTINWNSTFKIDKNSDVKVINACGE